MSGFSTEIRSLFRVLSSASEAGNVSQSSLACLILFTTVAVIIVAVIAAVILVWGKSPEDSKTKQRTDMDKYGK